MERYKVCYTDENKKRSFKEFPDKDLAIRFYAALPVKSLPILWDTHNTYPKARR